uniref:Med12-LCEWAV domain-containing protein n=1 Tax=Steinernema glaseri TaxID=37863 RepID=A0A1I7Z8Y9_9BILA
MLECPQALIWNSFRVSSHQTLPNQLCGSPLDILPCTPDELPVPAGPAKDSVLSILKSRIEDIKRRSWAVKRLWALNSNEENTFTLTVERVLVIITALDTIDVTDPRAIVKTYVKIFGTWTTEQFEYQTAITVKVMLQWAVTAQRGESYRVSVVIALLKRHLLRYRDNFIAPDTKIQDVLMEFLSTECPEPGAPHFAEEYRYIIFLFYELQRARIFSHDKYVQDLIRSGDLNHAQPVMMKLRDGIAAPEDKENPEEKENGKEPREQDLLRPLFPKSLDKASKDSKTELIEEEPDHHILMSKNDNLSRHERFLIHLPIQQIELNRSDRNQRLVMLYGIGEDREQATAAQKRIADNIAKIWQKKVNLEIPDASKALADASSKENAANRELRFRRKPAENYSDCIATFKTQTYYDQHVIANICADSFLDMFHDFLTRGGQMIPTSESLDVLFYLLEYCMNIDEIISVSIELISLLIKCDKEVAARQVPIIPGSASAQHGHVIAAYLSSHYQYFLMHPEAHKLLRGLFELVEPQLRPRDKEACMSSWGRSVAVFMLTAKVDLIKVHNGVDLIQVGRLSDLRNVFPSSEAPLAPPKYSNGDRENAFSEIMKDLKVRRFMNYHEYKKKLALLNQSPGAGISLILAAYNAALDGGRRIEVLSDIATVIAHFAANKPLEGDIYLVVDELCCSQHCKEKILPSSSRLKTENVEHLYTMATLTALLAAKHCISAHALIMRLLQGVFKPFTSTPIPGSG